MSESDENLLRRVAQGDGQCLKELLLRHSPPIRRWLGSKIPRRWRPVLTVDDVMQQTYTDVFLNIKGYVSHPDGRFGAWLRTIAEHNLIEAARRLDADKRGKGRVPISIESARDSLFRLYRRALRTQSTPSRKLAREEAQVAVQAAIRRLPEAYCLALTLYDLDGKPIAEVAQILNRSPGAVHMIRNRAIRRLGEMLGSSASY